MARQFEDFRQAEVAGAIRPRAPADARATGRASRRRAGADVDEVTSSRAAAPDRFGRGFAGEPELASALLRRPRHRSALPHPGRARGGHERARPAPPTGRRCRTFSRPAARPAASRARPSTATFRQRPPDRDHLPRTPFRRRGGTPRLRPNSRLGEALLELPDIGKAHQFVQLRHRIGGHRRPSVEP